jgi:hypothetical protein
MGVRKVVRERSDMKGVYDILAVRWLITLLVWGSPAWSFVVGWLLGKRGFLWRNLWILPTSYVVIILIGCVSDAIGFRHGIVIQGLTMFWVVEWFISRGYKLRKERRAVE